MSHTTITRRDFFGRTLVGLSIVGVGGIVAGCGGEEGPTLAECGTTGLTPAEQTMRTQVGYAVHATSPTKTCSRCQLYRAPASPDACGGCSLNLGAVNPTGTCNSFAART